ncbi:hypothetical protein JOQ06_008223 [Pogonophryne albipinna]|uniref:Uncharacterized protein n=1 Tax=Pogonophryne albipinna TaxID=1090488 RepID=A0AAD6FA42_9TELE|nr:hypothetical protein JOQ06_008223 [Pogonophryne albipinna]
MSWCSLSSAVRWTPGHPILIRFAAETICPSSMINPGCYLAPTGCTVNSRQTDLRSSAAAAKEKQERWRSSIRPTGRTHEIRGQLLGGSLEEKIVPVSLIFQGVLPGFSDGDVAV